MKPTIENFNQWLSDINDNEHYLNKTFTQCDIDALEECFSIFLGDSPLKEKMNELKDYKELESFFTTGEVPLVSSGREDWLINGKIGLEFRQSKVGYSCDKDFYVCSLKPELRDYTFNIWHDFHNTQIMVNRSDSAHHIRIMWSRLFKAIYEFYSTKVEVKELNLFDFAA